MFHLIVVHRTCMNSFSSSRVKPLGECRVFKKSDKGKEISQLLMIHSLVCIETHVEIRESVRSKDVFIIQTGSTK